MAKQRRKKVQKQSTGERVRTYIDSFESATAQLEHALNADLTVAETCNLVGVLGGLAEETAVLGKVDAKVLAQVEEDRKKAYETTLTAIVNLEANLAQREVPRQATTLAAYSSLMQRAYAFVSITDAAMGLYTAMTGLGMPEGTDLSARGSGREAVTIPGRWHFFARPKALALLDNPHNDLPAYIDAAAGDKDRLGTYRELMKESVGWFLSSAESEMRKGCSRETLDPVVQGMAVAEAIDPDQVRESGLADTIREYRRSLRDREKEDQRKELDKSIGAALLTQGRVLYRAVNRIFSDEYSPQNDAEIRRIILDARDKVGETGQLIDQLSYLGFRREAKDYQLYADSFLALGKTASDRLDAEESAMPKLSEQIKRLEDMVWSGHRNNVSSLVNDIRGKFDRASAFMKRAADPHDYNTLEYLRSQADHLNNSLLDAFVVRDTARYDGIVDCLEAFLTRFQNRIASLADVLQRAIESDSGTPVLKSDARANAAELERLFNYADQAIPLLGEKARTEMHSLQEHHKYTRQDVGSAEKALTAIGTVQKAYTGLRQEFNGMQDDLDPNALGKLKELDSAAYGLRSNLLRIGGNSSQPDPHLSFDCGIYSMEVSRYANRLKDNLATLRKNIAESGNRRVQAMKEAIPVLTGQAIGYIIVGHIT
ncbi:MAG: hypothetical protein ABH879_00770 [archaeon]